MNKPTSPLKPPPLDFGPGVPKTSGPTTPLEFEEVIVGVDVPDVGEPTIRMGPPTPTLPVVALTPMTMLDRAVASGASVDVLKELMGLQERWEANQARQAFDEAMAAAKANMPVIFKSQEKTGAGGTFRYEDMAAIARAIDPILAEQGLNYRFLTESLDNGQVRVTCIISHRYGHREQTSLSSALDTSGSKNAIQSIGSTTTYLQRYTLKAALGLAASKDEETPLGAGDPITDEQWAEISRLLVDSNTNPIKFCSVYNIPGVADLPAIKYDEAIDLLKHKLKKMEAKP